MVANPTAQNTTHLPVWAMQNTILSLGRPTTGGVGRYSCVQNISLHPSHVDRAILLICHSRTTNLAALTRQADVLVAAAGCARMVTAEMVKPGAIVIDVGINALPGGGMVGDVDFASVREVAGAITPVPGGVGPLTNVMLLKQCVQAAWQLAGEKKDFKTAA